MNFIWLDLNELPELNLNEYDYFVDVVFADLFKLSLFTATLWLKSALSARLSLLLLLF